MRKIILLLAALIGASPALADWTGKDASGATITFKNSNTCSSVVCIPIAQLTDGTGAAIGVTGSPLFINFGTGVTLPGYASTPTFNCGTGCFQTTQPVSGTVAATQSGAWNIGSITTLPSLVAGSAIIGKVGIDQTTPGTTNLVALAANQSVNQTQINGVAVLAGNGVSGTGSQRVNIASDNTAFSTKVSDGTNIAAVKAGSTPVVVTDPSLAVQAIGLAQASTTSGQTGSLGMGAVSATPPSYVSGQTDPLSLTTSGRLRNDASGTTVGSDPSTGAGTPTSTFLALPATTTTQIVALSGTTKIYVTSYRFMAGGTVNVTFKFGTGTNCGTGTTTLEGPWPLTAQSGMTAGAGTGAILIVPAGNALCVTTDASVSGGVALSYQQL